MPENKKKPKTITFNNKTFEVPDAEVLCEECGTTNYFYSDDKPPFRCDNCGVVLENIRPETP